MQRYYSMVLRGVRIVALAGAVFLAALAVSAILPAWAHADSPPPANEGAEKCAACHSTEALAWRNSSHGQRVALGSATDASGADAQVVATCETCHGAYVEGHPKNGVMQLDADSSVCQQCHAPTFDQWKASAHAQAGLQCIGCHQSHSQDFRLTDEALCIACHRAELGGFSHTSHKTETATCVDCHVSASDPSELGPASTEALAAGGATPTSHRFARVTSGACVNCHDRISGTADPAAVSMTETSPHGQPAPAADIATTALLNEAASQIEDLEHSNRSLNRLALGGLGLGMGVGGVMGVVFVLVIGYIIQWRGKQ